MNYFLQAFKKIFTYQGRARRAEYGWFLLINFLVQIAIALTISVLFGGAAMLNITNIPGYFINMGTAIVLTNIALVICGIVTFLVMLSLVTRRLHDLGWSGWWQLVAYLAPLLWLIILFVLLPIIEQTSLNPVLIVNISIWLILIAYFIFNLILLFKDGQKHPNKYGESPKYVTQAEISAE